MTIKVYFQPVQQADHYVIDRATSSSGTFANIASVTGAIPGAGYDASVAAMFYVDTVGTAASWYRIAPVDTLAATGSYTDPFQVGSSYIGSLTTVANVKAYLGLATSTDDTLISRLVDAASTWFHKQTGVRVAQSTYVDTYDGDGTRTLILDNDTVTAIASLSVDGTAIPARTSTTGSGYVLGADCIKLSSDLRFTKGTENVSVTYTAGFYPVPGDVEQAVIEMAALAYRNRTRVGVMSNTVGGESVSYQTTSVPFSVKSVVDQWTKQVI